MSGKAVADANNSNNNVSARWAALDSRLERLASATDRVVADHDDKDRELKAAS